ncbi:NAD(P)-dependent oxidoreductase [Sulfuracidifex tepidarius]|uniref:2-hydroxy-3-oxopropionate reductase n=1 Tax=Sulfuracidifex tepidarius TaxID=1294262 RepID=A0A510DV14_9CREN|nr:NAD(P)-dependent oxidoreductase [Sulfuracidifex tepidarius]BBG23890.1 2-hydroxy-3-oxopropionate reductase [Sulfuracidifex tepidarius]BBG26645.1 2-hydroxy-3-oxopropionate reductase [Sulfuracidifex tepidarius]
MKIGLIGLGVMGYRIGANLAKEGKLDGVYNRSEEKSIKFEKEFGVKAFKSIDEIVESSDVIITMLSDDNAVSTTIEKVIPRSKGKTIVDMSTISPKLSIALSRKIQENGGFMLDAPVIGTSIMVEQKKLVVMVGGIKEKFDDIKPILESTASTVIYMGKNGSGLYAKLVNNLLLGAYVVAIGEAFNFGVTAGLEKQQVEEVLTKLSSARSPTTDLKVPKLVSQDYSTQFATKHMRKDLEIIQGEATSKSIITPMSSLALQFYRIAESLGLSEDDFCSVYEVFRRFSKKA